MSLPALSRRVACGLLLSILGVLACSGSASAETQTFTYTGTAQTFTVPAGVSSITVDARGAAGGESGGASYAHAAGGMGARVQGTLAVTSGETLQVNVGGQGGTQGDEKGGFNGGGFGGSDSNGNAPEVAGGGGGHLISAAASTRSPSVCSSQAAAPAVAATA
jgi:hypothetical protein